MQLNHKFAKHLFLASGLSAAAVLAPDTWFWPSAALVPGRITSFTHTNPHPRGQGLSNIGRFHLQRQFQTPSSSETAGPGRWLPSVLEIKAPRPTGLDSAVGLVQTLRDHHYACLFFSSFLFDGGPQSCADTRQLQNPFTPQKAVIHCNPPFSFFFRPLSLSRQQRRRLPKTLTDAHASDVQ